MMIMWLLLQLTVNIGIYLIVIVSVSLGNRTNSSRETKDLGNKLVRPS